MLPATVRTALLEVAPHLGHDLVLEELVRFLPAATCQEFLEHLEEVADISDLY